ncbi:MAG TPA: DeoR/GlpR family DNA-binding transcription regulator [Candidatus Hungatella pullicola]|nr:DeoR/GlpR family DNA-binding transcription regulator [Candidatus Hungatella pullicola]
MQMGMKEIRLREMEQYVFDHDTVSMEELSGHFDISMNTVRSDVAQLVKKGTIRKIYGGVCSNQKNGLIPFDERKTKNALFKETIGRVAAGLVKDGDIIYIDSGTTTMYMIDYMESLRGVTILTHSLNVIMRAIPCPNLNVICLPGTLERATNSVISLDSVRILEQYNIGKAFMASSGVTVNGTITNSSPLEFEIKKAAIHSSSKSYLVMDSTKFGKSALMSYAHLKDMDKVISDENMPPEFLKLCSQMGVGTLLGKVNEKSNISNEF